MDPFDRHGSMSLHDDLVWLPVGPPEWMRDASCAVRPELPWTAGRYDLDSYTVRTLAGICAACPVRRDCTEFADRLDVNAGFWAGTIREHTRSHPQPSIRPGAA